jgi:hypothetical protein
MTKPGKGKGGLTGEPIVTEDYWHPQAEAYFRERDRDRAKANEIRSRLTPRQRKLFDVAERGVKGPAYCRELQNARLRPCRAWIEQGCPGTYPEAYHDPYWRQMIQDEKSKVCRKARKTTG